MRSFQTKFMAALETAVEGIDAELEIVQVANYSNTGRLYVQHSDSFATLLTVDYDFQVKTKIEFNRSEYASVPAVNSFYFGAADSQVIELCYERFVEILDRATRQHAA